MGKILDNIASIFERTAARREQTAPSGGPAVTVSFAPWSLDPAPPKAPETVGNPVKPWAETWGAFIAQHYCPPGWTACKFGVRGMSEAEGSDVWGIVRDGQGVYLCRFWIVTGEDDPGHADYLAVVVNARNGYAFGIFSSIEHACGAAEIAARLSTRDEHDQHKDSAYQRLGFTLNAAGYATARAWCRPMQGDQHLPGRPFPVWVRTEIDAARDAQTGLALAKESLS